MYAQENVRAIHLNSHDEHGECRNRTKTEGKKTRSASLLSPERAALCQASLSAGGLAKDGRAAGADDDGLCVGEDSGDGEAAWALNIHEE